MNLRTLTVSEAAHATGRSAKTIRRLYDDGVLTGPKVGRKRLIAEVSLQAWVNRAPELAPASTMATRAFPEVKDRFA